MKDRKPEGVYCVELWLRFVEPSENFPIGWNSGDKGGYFSDRVSDHAILSVYIPWDAESSDVYSYNFPMRGMVDGN